MTIHNAFLALRKLLGTAEEWNYLVSNPAAASEAREARDAAGVEGAEGPPLARVSQPAVARHPRQHERRWGANGGSREPRRDGALVERE
jgi:hypothetical protein